MFREAQYRKLSIGEIFSVGWKIYSKKFKPIVIITLLIYVPINVLLYVIAGSLSDMYNSDIYLNLISILEGLFGIIAAMAISLIVHRTILDENIEESGWNVPLNKAVSRWGHCLVTNILAGLIIIGLLILLIIPGIIWAIYYSFIIQVVILKNLSGKKALNYSKSLVKGQWWRVFWVVLLINLSSTALGLLIGAISIYIPDIVGILTDTIIDIVGAYFTVMTTLFYINLDSLREWEVISDNNMS